VYRRNDDGPLEITIITHSFKLNRDKTIPKNIWKKVSQNVFWTKTMTAEQVERLMQDPNADEMCFSGGTGVASSSSSSSSAHDPTTGFHKNLVDDDSDSDD